MAAERRPCTEQVEEWFGERGNTERSPDEDPAPNIAIVCGGVSDDLCVRDFDSDASYNAWASDFPDYAKTLPSVAHCEDNLYACSQDSIALIVIGRLKISSSKSLI